MCNSTESNKHGCLDGQAYNYDATASIDNNTCTYIDSCGVIDIDITNDCVQDCAGVWDGDAIVNECLLCSNISCDATGVYYIINNCGSEMGESLECVGKYDLSSESAAACPLYAGQVTTTGIIVDYFDITPFGGPHSFTIQDWYGNQLDFLVWPESSSYQDGFDITQSDLNIMSLRIIGG